MPPLRACSLCARRQTLEAYPIPSPEPPERQARVCLDCLRKNLVGHAKGDLNAYLQRKGLQRLPLTPLDPRAEHLHAEAPNPLKRKSSNEPDDGAPGAEAAPPPAETDAPLRRKARKRPRKSPFRRPGRRERPGPPAEMTCRICAEDKAVAAFPRATRKKAEMEVPAGCQAHLGVRSRDGPACKACIAAFLAAGVAGGRVEALGCLEPGCAGVFDDRLVQVYLAGTPALDEYLERHLRLFLLRAWVLRCAHRGCEGAGLLEMEVAGYPQVECGECGGRMCANCGVAWHAGRTCQQYRAKYRKAEIDGEEREVLKSLAREGYKRCPRCQLAVLKEYGCNHVFCNYCYYEFSYDDAEPVQPLGSEQGWTKTAKELDWAARAHNADYSDRCEADEVRVGRN